MTTQDNQQTTTTDSAGQGSDAPVDFSLDFSFEPAGAEGPQGSEGSQQSAPPSEAPTPPPAPDAAAPAGEEERAGPEPAAPPTPSAPAREAPSEDPREKLIKDQQALIERLLAQPKAEAPKPEPQKVERDPATELPEFARPYLGIKFPQELHTALQSDEPAERAAALDGIVSAVMVRLTRDITKHLEDRLTAFRQEVPQVATSAVTQQTEAQRIMQDFTSSFPVFGAEAWRPQVVAAMQAEAQAWAQRGGNLDWTPEFKAAVAQRLSQSFGIPIAPQAPPAPPAQQGNGVAKPKGSFSTGSGAGRGGSSPPSEFADILNF